MCGLKLFDKILDLLGIGDIFIGHSADVDFILNESHEYRVEILMGYLQIIFGQ